MRVLGLDIGGANLKAADGDERAVSVPFALWKNPAGLAAALGELCARFEPADRFAVTMTGELCDCFETKAEGVAHILDAVDEVANGRPVWVWQTSGEFVDPQTAREFWQLTAAANWHATATFVGRCVPEGTALLIDMGSTTTDLIPLEDGVPVPTGRTDLERLKSRELIYTGVGRTPLASLWPVAIGTGDGREVEICPAAELFATTHDLYLISGEVPEEPTNLNTADGRPATAEHARTRVAKMALADRTELTDRQIDRLAAEFRAKQCQLVRHTLEVQNALTERVFDHVLFAGAGRFLGPDLIGDPVRRVAGLESATPIDLSDLLSPAVSAGLPAHAVARLCDERC
ncbi:hydantoinase/oxoprolinase family protein [Alienimonas californiensis]|uniref:Hydantoinase/oxoprolinase n=1 Tax=Alienimonas californiensis TaxID=2527989 RepID=A0A517P7G6_9PLAN|nr:hydantoinase/oxoprolinase family protein [Alienimonas californiensis]QDT15310.1 Hydantoinase/oxoprolinase [Alienimonas californiensis]